MVQSDGIHLSHLLVHEYCNNALSSIDFLTDSKYKWALTCMVENLRSQLKQLD